MEKEIKKHDTGGIENFSRASGDLVQFALQCFNTEEERDFIESALYD
jgi:hypothetical protein